MFKAVFASMLIVSSGFSAAQARAPNDTFYPLQWYLRQINAEAAWDKTVGSDKVVVAVIDTGVDIEHEDLRENIWTNAGEIPGNGIDDDKNGYADDVHGWNFLTNTNDVRPIKAGGTEEGFVHGTLVASLIGARGNNDIGVAGVAWNVKLMPVVALDETGGGSSGTVADAVRYAANNGAQIINLSLEGYTESSALASALAYARSKGVLTVAASGNGEGPAGFDLDMLPVYPACLSLDSSFGVITAGGTDTLDQKASHSNYGSCVDLTAPAYNLFGARPVSASATGAAAGTGYEGGYKGTSLAAPLVSGVAALLKSVHPEWRAEELRARLIISSLPIDDLQAAVFRGKLGHGRLDAAAALSDFRTGAPANFILSATLSGRATRVRVTSGKNSVELKPYGPNDRRGARAAFTDLNGDGTPEIFVVPASGRDLEWVWYGLDGQELKRGTLVKDLKGGVLLAAVGDGGVVLAEAGGGRAWGLSSDMKATEFHPYGPVFNAGLDLLGIAGAAAFAPRGGGGHLVVTDVKGRTLVAAFPFGVSARGRWSLARLPTASGRPESLVLSGPLGSRYLDASKLGPTGWRDIGLQDLEAAKPLTSSGRAMGDASVRQYE